MLKNHQSLAEVLKLNKEKRARRLVEERDSNAQLKQPIVLENIVATRVE